MAAPDEENIIKEERLFEINNFAFKAIFTPGHSPGSISYIFENDGFAIVGDTLFEQGVGRTDLIGGSTKVLLASIHDKLLTLPEDMIVYPAMAITRRLEQRWKQTHF